ncbi:MAG: PorT family protein [Muribaculaceae bacterium]|nr:PorT family protein [Muribaculaceae bacterium]
MRLNLLKLAVIMFAACPLSGMAQKWNFGVEAGYVNSTLALKDYDASARSGFKVGANAEFTLRNHISFESGLAYIRKGAEIKGDKIGHTSISSIKFAEMNYLQIPLMAGYKFNLAKDFSIKPEVGGYFAVGLNGHSFVTGLDSFNQPYEARVSTFSHTFITDGIAPYRPCDRADGGLAFALNLNYRHFTLKAEYDLGLATATYYGNGKQRTLSVSLAYWLF